MSDKFFIGGIDGYYTTSAAVTIGVKGEKGDGDRKHAHYPIAACRNNDGGLEIGVYLPQQMVTLQAAVPFLRVVCSEVADSHGLVCCWNAEAAASAYTGSCFTPNTRGHYASHSRNGAR
jgi:hypothetical protein